MKSRVIIKSSRSGMTVILDPACDFEELLDEVTRKFKESARFWGNVQIALILEGRALTAQEELRIVNAITENSGIEVLCLIDQDANRIERCEKALNQKLMELSAATGQFYRGDLHRGESMESETSLVIIGNVYHGSRVTSRGSVIVLGELRGSVHAGVSGNLDAVVCAMEMAPLQIRIADAAMHCGEKGRRLGRGPMVASVEHGEISARPLTKFHFFAKDFI
ncbi:MAG: septum site-determining protein MinC [Clostridiales bacterium]|nr:septum site-determining protein MinC [Clostridiales bacterium]